jgi:ABC-type nitrate/sulfonate/bicarbonate transport system substrate-binding protein
VDLELKGKRALVSVNGNVIKNVQDFAGKRIAVERGSGANFHLAWFLDRNKIPPDRVTLEYLAVPDQLPALARGDVQVAFSWEPLLTRAAETIPRGQDLRG